MSHFVFTITLLASLILSPGLGTFHQPQVENDPENEAIHFIELLSQGKYAEAYAPFDEPMRKAISPQGLQEIWEDLVTKYGNYQSVGQVRVEQAGRYTAANVHTYFERAEVNIRVVFSETGQISGLFYTPLLTTGSIPVGLIIAFAFTGIFTIIYPVLVGLFTKKRFGVSWKYFFYGAGIFIIFQLITRIPIISLIEGLFGRQLRSTTWLLAAWVIVLSFTAGLFEETGRYVGYRWMMNRDPKTWKVGVMYGLGHGGIESIILVGLNNLIAMVIILFFPYIQSFLPQEVSGVLAQQVGGLVGIPDWMPILAAWERLWILPVHVALSVIVLQTFRRSSFKWVWLAIAFHTLVNLFVVGLALLVPLRPAQQPVISSLPVMVVGLLAIWIAWRLRDEE